MGDLYRNTFYFTTPVLISAVISGCGRLSSAEILPPCTLAEVTSHFTRWPACVRATAAAAVLVKEDDK